MNRELLVSYAQAFVSYLFRVSDIKLHEIKAIYLFGSVARGDFDRDSDVDIFIDTGKDMSLKKSIERSLKNFYNSEERKKFQFMGIENEIKVLDGNLEEWELKDSVKTNGIILYSSSIDSGLKRYFLVIFEPIKDIAKRNRIIRKLFGRREKYYIDKGLVSELNGQIIESRAFILPSEQINKILKIFSKEKVKYKIKQIYMS